jgi:hypothetical protein
MRRARHRRRWRVLWRQRRAARPHKKGLKRSGLPTDFATWSAIARDRPRLRLLAHSTPTPSPPALNLPTPSLPTPSSPTPNQPPANPNAPLPGYGNFTPAYVAPARYAPLAQAQYAETRAADRAARYAARANRASAPPQQHHLPHALSSATEEEDSEYFSNYLRLFCTRMPVLRRQDLL